jgi:hypothetical protein
VIVVEVIAIVVGIAALVYLAFALVDPGRF